MRDIAALLLVVQGGMGLLAALGLLSYARLSNATAFLAGPEVIAFGGVALLLLIAIGVLKGWRVATLAACVWQGFTILGNAISVLASGGGGITLTLALTGFGLPAAITLLLLTRQPSQLRTRLIVGLLLATGMIHLALAPAHLQEPPKLGGLFALDGFIFIVLAVACARDSRWWRPATAAVLLATISAYAVVVISKKEAVDDLGIATKTIELLALGLVLWPDRVRVRRRLLAASAVLTTIVVAGGVLWAASLRPGATHAHFGDGKVVLAEAPPSDQQRADAARLVEETRDGIARYADVRVALADGYRPSTPPAAPTVHYTNQRYVRDGVMLDPARPQALVYANSASGPLLLGAMYMLPKANILPPDVGGSLVEWHAHTNLCFLVPSFAIDGLQTPFGTCPVGSINGPTPAMLHVWTVPNPGGPFGELSPAYVARLAAQ